MTLAFENFLKQHNAEGSEKADGYSTSLLTELDVNEKEMDFELLESKLPWSIEWLFLLDRDKALSTAKEEEAKRRGDSYADVFCFSSKLLSTLAT